MKVAAQPSFWPLRPIVTAVRIELICWAAAAGLAVALALAPAPTGATYIQAQTPTVATVPPSLTAYQTRCTDRIVRRAVGRSEEYVARLINQLCIQPFRARVASLNSHARLPCDRRFPGRWTPGAKLVAGCPGG
ncbi:MAG TPA: hypothetical protein VG104_00510 [Candidatus Dormibacteraeota bacterium]|nr:hypothetical protein [Candidatus Dormibacteraeota bacterium]